MTKTHFRGRYAAAVRLAVVGLRIVELSLVLAGVLLLCCPDALALDPALDVSQYAHTAWKIRDGFTKGNINAIEQTPDGYLWLGTEFGLFRFDGVRAVPWEPQGQSLPFAYISKLLAASDGTLWIGTLKGLASWKAGNLTQYPELADHLVLQMLEDREGTVWAGAVGVGFGTTTGRLCAIRKGSVQCSEDGSFRSGVVSLFEDSKGTLWVGVKEGLWRWKPGPPKFFSLPGETDGVRALGGDTDGTLLVGWKGGLWRFVDGKTEPYRLPRSLQKFRAENLLRDRDGGLWIGTNDRGIVHVHDGRTDVFSASDGLSSENVGYAFQDREGSIWIATQDGLDRFRDFAVATISVNQGLANASVSSVVADGDGTIWLANRTLQRWKNGRVVTDEKNEQKFRGHFPHSLFRDHRGRIWVCTIDGVGYFENKQFVPVTGIPGGAAVHGITEDAAGNVWIANQNAGLFRLSARGEVQKIPRESLGNDDLVYALAGDPVKGGLWIGFLKGGIAYLRDGQGKASYSTADGLGQGWLTELRADSDGTLWVATQGGLSRLKNGRISTLNTKNGLPCDAVLWSMEDDDHSLWMNTACGLVRIERPDMNAWAAAVDKDKDAKRTVQATVFGSSDGVRVRGIAGGSAGRATKSPDGKLWFTQLDGLSVIDPRHLPFNKIPPPVHIEQITADRKTYEVPSGASGSMPLPALIQDLQIDYTALSLMVPEKVLFRYKLEGFDKDWHDAGNRRQAFYTNLPPRNYRFRVKACNNSGVWNEAGTFLDFAVAPAYYQTTWFRLSCVAAFLALLVGLYRLRLQQVAHQFNIRLEARVGERTRIARELHDSLLQGVQGLMFRLQAVRELLRGRAPAEAIEALDVALERGDKVIVEGRDTISDLRQSAGGDSDIAQALTALGEELAAQSNNGAAPCVRVLVEGKQRELDPALRDEIYRIAREALRNAFRHAKAQKIEAQITYGESEFLLHVRDDGIGITHEVTDQGARAGHWGLPGMRERAKSFGGKLEVWSEHGAGTEIALTVPAAVSYGKSNARHKSWFLRKRN